MNGAKHYQEAEAHLKYADDARGEGDTDEMNYYLGMAQVHATLALTAATTLTPLAEQERLTLAHQWRETLGSS